MTPKRHVFKLRVKLRNTVGAFYLTFGGSALRATSLDESMPLCLKQAPFISQPSGSPQSQQPPTFVFNQVLWPSWSLLLKQSRQIMQVGSFSQSSHFQATSPALSTLAQTPRVKWSSQMSAIKRSGSLLSKSNSLARWKGFFIFPYSFCVCFFMLIIPLSNLIKPVGFSSLAFKF